MDCVKLSLRIKHSDIFQQIKIDKILYFYSFLNLNGSFQMSVLRQKDDVFLPPLACLYYHLNLLCSNQKFCLNNETLIKIACRLLELQQVACKWSSAALLSRMQVKSSFIQEKNKAKEMLCSTTFTLKAKLVGQD